jgi:hypothetical protein
MLLGGVPDPLQRELLAEFANADPPESDGYAERKLHVRTLMMLMKADAAVDVKAFG